MPAHSSAKASSIGTAQPSRRPPLSLVAAVLAVHMALVLGLSGTLEWRLQTAEPIRVAPMQTRWVPPTPAPTLSPVQAAAPQARTRVATEPKAAPAPDPTPATPPAPPVDVAMANDSAMAEPTSAPTPQTTPEPTPSASDALSASEKAQEIGASPAPASPLVPEASSASAAVPADTASTALPPIPLGALPPPVLLSYRLTGQDKGLNYHASGELRWQHNETAYALGLSVKAFLVGTRHWRSQGDITSAGLAPNRFSDSWRNERAAHFDRMQNRVIFSNNAPVAVLEAGAQDQISLYVQLAAAMAGEPQRFQPGTRLLLQTATIRDALPWLLTLGAPETLQLNGQAVSTLKWVCQPRNRFDATVEFWVSAQHAWMPVRIRITQVSGSYIDLVMRGQEALPPLPASAPAGEKTTPS
ncbi:DUF3108 domain-containing protein [Limnohabitans sp. 2KL-27]|uniref:DUF3108 domain-containing protein n=1 Tax=Limnohabitans sp. 2KL-27 TaxID=1100705 RepID=UPI000A662C9D|nr:DUF3108 domain-containing protein [Limnohabitans sp. 2KL-27]